MYLPWGLELLDFALATRAGGGQSCSSEKLVGTWLGPSAALTNSVELKLNCKLTRNNVS